MGFFTRQSSCLTLDPKPPEVSDAALRALMSRVSRGDTEAFAELFDHTSAALQARLLARLGDPAWATAVLTATYVEVWWLAGCHTSRQSEVRPWIVRIAVRRVADRRPGDGTPEQHSYAATELATLLGRSADSLHRSWSRAS